jgi:hypothetical protein
MSAKIIHVQAKKSDGSLVFNSSITGKTNRQYLIRSAMLKLDEYSGIATIRAQEEGARGWVYYRYECRSDHCEIDRTIKW